MPVGELERDLGRLEARADSTDDRLRNIEAKLDQVLSYIERNRGGIRMLFAVSSIAATLGAGIAEFIHWINRS